MDPTERKDSGPKSLSMEVDDVVSNTMGLSGSQVRVQGSP